MKRFYLLILLTASTLFVAGADTYFLLEAGELSNCGGDDSLCVEKNLGDIFKKKNAKPKPPKEACLLILPNISSNPSNGFLLGVGGQIGWYMADKTVTKVSSAPFTFAFTSKKQLITFVKHNVFTYKNKFFLQGDWRYYIYSQPTYGLGTNSPDIGSVPENVSWMGETTEKDSVSFPMKFDFIKVHEIVSRQIIGDFYIGLGYHLDNYSSIEDEKFQSVSDSSVELDTPHHFYSAEHGFDMASYTLSGVSLNLLYDTRDNQISPYKGIYANINYKVNPEFLGSDQSSSELWLEFRTYKSLSKKTPRHLIGFWTFAHFGLSGSMPYLTLPNLGEDQRARSGRGYTNGRFRGENIIYGEVEYRFPISRCSKILGGVVFVNATTTSNERNDVKLFDYIVPAAGVGIRIMINKDFRTNINLDYAVGKETSGFYFSGAETF